MLEFEKLDEYEQIFGRLDYDQRQELFNKIDLPKNEKWLLGRFLKGRFSNGFAFDRLLLVPGCSDVSYDAIETFQAGINEHFVERVGLNIGVLIGEEIPKISGSVSRTTYETEEGKFFRKRFDSRYLKQLGMSDGTFYGIVVNADFFEGWNQRVAGIANGIHMTLLDRSFRKGRFLDGKILGMNEQERSDYSKLVAAHETYHLVGMLDDLSVNG